MPPSKKPERKWQTEASRVLKSRLARQGMSYSDLVTHLNANGGDESYASVANKVSRGTFTFAFYLQCLYAMGIAPSDIDATQPIDRKWNYS